jgi:SagB-type dehydrogenase family enzyme
MKAGLIFIFLCGPCLAQGYDFLVRDAERQIQAGEYQKALDLYEKAFKSGEFHYNDFIHAARAKAHLGMPDDAFEYLHKAVKTGFMDGKALEAEPDLESLRGDARWAKVLAAVKALKESMTSAFPETHPGEPVFDLPESVREGKMSVEAAMQARRSVRRYTDTPMTLAEISQLLWAAYGITKPMKNAPAFIRGGLRAAPSAGARFPLDVYVVAWNVTDLPAGVYWYKSEEHKLVQIAEGDKREALSKASFDQTHFRTAAAALVYSAVFQRNMAKYGQRGRERYVCMDLGHSGENVYLQAVPLKVGTCAIGAFVDLWVKKVVGMTRDEEPLYIMPLGKVE